MLHQRLFPIPVGRVTESSPGRRRDQSINISLANVFVGVHVGNAREGEASLAGGRDIELIEIGHDGSQSLKDEGHRQVGADLIQSMRNRRNLGILKSLHWHTSPN